MDLHKRKDSPYWVVDMVHPGTGERLRRSTKEVSREAAKIRAWEMFGELVAATRKPRTPITLQAAIDTYAASLKANGQPWAEEVLRLRDRMFGLRAPFSDRYHLSPDRLLSTLTTADLEKLAVARRAEGVAPQGVKHELAALRAACGSLRPLGYDVPTITDWRMPAKPSRSKGAKRPVKYRDWTWPEWRQVYAALIPTKPITWTRCGETYRAPPSATLQRHRREALDVLIGFTLTHGRWPAVGALMWSQFDTLGWKEFRQRTESGAEVSLPLPPEFAEVLKRRLACRRNGAAHVFKIGETIPKQSSRLIADAIDTAGLNPEATVQRHGRAILTGAHVVFARWLVGTGIAPETVARVSGHSLATLRSFRKA